MRFYTRLAHLLSPTPPGQDDVRARIIPLLADGMTINGIVITRERHVSVIVTIDPATTSPHLMEQTRQNIAATLDKTPGVTGSQVILTAARTTPAPPSAPPPGPAKTKTTAQLDVPAAHIIAVASGKGGVGKSTVAANLAVALAQAGQRVGLLDADIYGPSQPRLMGVTGHKPAAMEDGRLIPVLAHGVKVMSIGFMVDESAPIIWRGPMVQSALVQLLRDVAWDDLDILIIDMPPGTGDTQLTLAQKVKLSGAVIVSTPQDIALADARKGLAMFQQVGVPILGVIENMSIFCCPNCGTETDIFRRGGAEQAALDAGVPFLGDIPLHPDLRGWSDAGTPSLVAAEGHKISQTYADIAQRTLTQLAASKTPFPALVMDDEKLAPRL
ncbi:MAG: Mrp/NBP35 family ATP-binding protein [Pseudomonadota bacterium]